MLHPITQPSFNLALTAKLRAASPDLRCASRAAVLTLTRTLSQSYDCTACVCRILREC